MKTNKVATGILGALAMAGALGLGACSAETGEQGAIGSTAQPIVIADVPLAGGPSLTISATDHPLVYQAAVKLTVSAVDYMVVIGGVTAEGSPNTYSSDAFVLKTTTGTWYGPFDISGKYSGGVAFGAVIQKPGDPTTALYFGGEDANGKIGRVTEFSITFSGGVPNGISMTDSGSITARSKLAVASCGNSSVLLMGGDTGSPSALLNVWESSKSGTTTALAALKDSTTPTAQTVTLNTTRFNAAVASNGSTKIVLAGGENGGGAVGSIEAIKTVNDATLGCKLDATLTHPIQDTTHMTARTTPAAVYDSTTTGVDTFLVAAGDTGTASALVTSVPVNWGTYAFGTFPAEAASVPVATKAPAFVVTGAAHLYLFGGSVRDFQEYTGAWTSVSKYSDNSTNIQLRRGASAVLANGNIYVLGGSDNATVGSGTLLATSELVTP